jgi:hypothetical protein
VISHKCSCMQLSCSADADAGLQVAHLPWICWGRIHVQMCMLLGEVQRLGYCLQMVKSNALYTCQAVPKVAAQQVPLQQHMSRLLTLCHHLAICNACWLPLRHYYLL